MSRSTQTTIPRANGHGAGRLGAACLPGDDTKAGKATAGVEFRFSQRLRDASTAHYTGIFHYWFAPKDGERTDSYVHFEGLLIKKTGEWKMVMEYQKQPATAQEWAAAEG
jgi:hypothetical protein